VAIASTALLGVAAASDASTCAIDERDSAVGPTFAVATIAALPGAAATCGDDTALVPLSAAEALRGQARTVAAGPGAAAPDSAAVDWTVVASLAATEAPRGIEDHTRMAPTPLPASAWLLASALVGLAAARRRPLGRRLQG
jgi:hypothetical protein